MEQIAENKEALLAKLESKRNRIHALIRDLNSAGPLSSVNGSHIVRLIDAQSAFCNMTVSGSPWKLNIQIEAADSLIKELENTLMLRVYN